MTYRIRRFAQMEFATGVVIISILALIAIPRISQLQVYARIVKLKTLRASVISAATIVHGALLTRQGRVDKAVCKESNKIADNHGGATGTLCMEDGIINLAYGYPTVTEFGKEGILSAAGLTVVFNPTITQVQAADYDYIKAGKVAIFRVRGGSDAVYCAFTYTEATIDTAPAVSDIIATGC